MQNIIQGKKRCICVIQVGYNMSLYDLYFLDVHMENSSIFVADKLQLNEMQAPVEHNSS